ncbi:caspase family protein [uncultured Cohaesibacter sp.]|uniref:caspase family protein n=1 Tax=uncultured Cohaesibacter sp. TaxID=1002546 RepID=UPI0029C94404|nr:caspase family protein [uncultured Cohaesibacter sp.]
MHIVSLRLWCLAVAISTLVALSTTVAYAEKRVALVIGNSDYQHVARLPNPQNDAASIAEALRQVGFDAVIEKNDLPFQLLNITLRDFAALADTADVALVFYAGHGMEVEKVNYLIPVDAALKSDRDVSYEAIQLDQVIQAVEGARRMRIVILDACRDNPFMQSIKRTGGTRSIGRGLSIVEPDQGNTLISFAAKAGTTADDGDAAHSPFTAALLAHLNSPGLEISKLFRLVRDQVLQETGYRQEPFTYGSLSSEDFYLIAPDQQAMAPPPDSHDGLVESGTSETSFDPRQLELAFWKSIENSNEASSFQSYLEQFPQGTFAILAKNKLAKLKEQPSVESSTGKSDWQAELAAMKEVKDRQPEYFAMATVPELAEAARFLPEAVAEGNAQAQYFLGYCYYHGGCGYEPNYAEASRLFITAAGQGNADAEASLGWLYMIGDGVVEEHPEGLKWLNRAADQGNVFAYNKLGYIHEEGMGVDQDYSKSAHFYQLAADQGDAGAKYSLGQLYNKGTGVPFDPQKSAIYLLEAGKGGIVQSKATVMSDEAADFLSTETRKAIQSELKKQGLYRGVVDGQFGPGTRQALKAYWGE